MSTAIPTLMPAPNAGARPEFDLHWRCRLAREFAGLEQAELSERAGISRATISTAENGRRVPSRATLRVWAAATGVAYDWLIGDSQTAAAHRATGGDGAPSRLDWSSFGPVKHTRGRDVRFHDGRRKNRGGGAR